MFNLRSSVLVFTGFKSTQRAMLKEVSPVHCSHWPLKITFHQQNRASRFETIDQEFFVRSEEHTSELQSLRHLVCRLLLDVPPPSLSPLFPYTTLFRSL